MKKNRWVFSGVLVLALIFGLALTACDDGGSSYNPYSPTQGDLSGTWTSSYAGRTVGLIVTSSNWSISIPALGYSDAGTYTMSGNVATLYSAGYTASVGSAVLLSSTRLTVVLNSNSIAPGTYTFTRVSY
jgi:hypothetical protein